MTQTQPQAKDATPLAAFKAWLWEQGGRKMWETHVESVGYVTCYSLGAKCVHVTEYYDGDDKPSGFDVYVPLDRLDRFAVQEELSLHCGL